MPIKPWSDEDQDSITDLIKKTGGPTAAGRAIGVSRYTIYRYENGTQQPAENSVATIRARIRKALGAK